MEVLREQQCYLLCGVSRQGGSDLVVLGGNTRLVKTGIVELDVIERYPRSWAFLPTARAQRGFVR
jgi:hypothetical protein